MEKIAAFLGVTPGYLSFGEGIAPAPGGNLTEARAQYRANLGWYWRPAPRDRGREFGNAAAYAFEVDIPTLGRESGQNTSDEKEDTQPTVELRYTVSELTGEHLAGFMSAIQFDAVRPHLEAAATTNLKAGTVIGRGLGQLDDDHRMLLIRIEDYGANGLTGPEFERGRFMAVARNTLDSQKSGTAGGSFGLGWATLPASSQFGMVLCNSTLVEANEGMSRDRFIGVIDLPWHTVAGTEYAGKGWFGQEDPNDELPPPRRTVSYWGNEALVRDTFLFRTDPRPGTSFMIVGAYDASGAVNEVEEIAEAFAESVADNFWPAMVERPDGPARLQVIVRAERNGDRILENYVDPARFQPARVVAFQKHLRDDVSETLEEEGDVVRRNVVFRVPLRAVEPTHGAQEHNAVLLVTQVGDDDQPRAATSPNAVTYMRGSQMVIQQSRVGSLPIGSRTFHAIVLAGESAGDSPADLAADRFLRAAEPPAHNKWMGTPEITTSYARGGKAAIDTFDAEVKKMIREIIRQPSRDLSDGPESLKELIRIVPPPPAGQRPQVKSVGAARIANDGAWEITDATLTLPPRPNGRGWTISPVLRFGTESGSPISVKWELITPGARCELDGRGRLVTPATARTAVFSGRTDPKSHPVGATRSTVVVDVRIHGDEVSQ
jgi:RNA polymerase primary sigma factor